MHVHTASHSPNPSLSPLPLALSLSPSSSSACNSCLSRLLCLCFTFPVLTRLFSAFFAIKGGGEYYHLEPSSVAGLMQSKPHTRKGTEMEIKYIQRKKREALSAPTGFRPSINFAINRIPLLPLPLHSHDVSPSLVEDAANTHVLFSVLHTDASSVFSN